MACSTPPCATTHTKEIQAAFGTLGVGLNWTFIGGNPDNLFSAGLILGPAVTSASLSQRVVNINSSAVTTDDFKMKANPVFMTALLGLQLGIKFSGFLLNPYAMVVADFREDPCTKYEVTQTTISGSLIGQSTPSCGGSDGMSAARSNYLIDLWGDSTALGVKLAFVPWGISVNLYTMPSKPKDVTLQGLNIKTYVVSFSFGG